MAEESEAFAPVGFLLGRFIRSKIDGRKGKEAAEVLKALEALPDPNANDINTAGADIASIFQGGVFNTPVPTAFQKRLERIQEDDAFQSLGQVLPQLGLNIPVDALKGLGLEGTMRVLLPLVQDNIRARAAARNAETSARSAALSGIRDFQVEESPGVTSFLRADPLTGETQPFLTPEGDPLRGFTGDTFDVVTDDGRITRATERESLAGPIDSRLRGVPRGAVLSAEDLGARAGAREAAGSIEDLNTAQTNFIRYATAADEAVERLSNGEPLVGVVGSLARGLEGFRKQIGQAGTSIGVSEDDKDFFTRFDALSSDAINSRVFRGNLLNLGVAHAWLNSPADRRGSITKQEVERSLDTLGFKSGDPNQVRASILAESTRLAEQLENTVESRSADGAELFINRGQFKNLFGHQRGMGLDIPEGSEIDVAPDGSITVIRPGQGTGVTQ